MSNSTLLGLQMIQAGRTLRIVLGLTAVATLASFRPGVAESAMHLRLLASTPAKDTTLSAPPTSLALRFSEAPQLKLSRLQLTGPTGKVPLGAVAVDPENATILTAAVTAAMAPGRYVIAWRTASADGHAISGKLPFRVAAAP